MEDNNDPFSKLHESHTNEQTRIKDEDLNLFVNGFTDFIQDFVTSEDAPIDDEQLFAHSTFNFDFWNVDDADEPIKLLEKMPEYKPLTYEDMTKAVTFTQDLAKVGYAGNNQAVEELIDSLKDNRNRMQKLEEKLFPDDFSKKKLTSDAEKKEVVAKLNHIVDNIIIDKDKYAYYELKSRRWALVFRVLSSALAALTTILLGINTGKNYEVQWYLNTIALFITAFISIIGVIQNFYDPSELFVKYADTSNRLTQLNDNIKYLMYGIDYVTIEQVNAIKREYNQIIADTYDYETRLEADTPDVASRVMNDKENALKVQNIIKK
jgi:hypothetical protein